MSYLLENRASCLIFLIAPIQNVGKSVQRQPREAHVAHYALLSQLRQRWQRLINNLLSRRPTSAPIQCLTSCRAAAYQ